MNHIARQETRRAAATARAEAATARAQERANPYADVGAGWRMQVRSFGVRRPGTPQAATSHIDAYRQFNKNYDADYRNATAYNRMLGVRSAASGFNAGGALGAGRRGLGMLGVGGLVSAGEGLMEAGPWAIPLALALSPQIGGLAAGAYNATTSRYTGYASRAYGLARAGGYAASSILGSGSDTIGQHFGMGRAEQMAAVSQYGIVPRSQGGFNGIFSAIGQSGLNPVTSSMDQSQVIGIMRQLGGSFGTSASSTNGALYDLLSRATAQGLDRSQLAQSFSSLMGNLASAGSSAVPGSIASLMANTATAAGTGAARSGSAVADVLGGAAANQSAFGSPVQTMMYMRAAGGVRSKSDLIRLVGGNAAYSALAGTGQGQAFISAMLNKNVSLADRAQELATNLPALAKFNLANSTYGSIFPGSPVGGLMTSAVAGFTGASPASTMAVQLGAGNKGTLNTPYASIYAAAAAKYGVSPAVLQAITGGAENWGFNPGLKNPTKGSTAFGLGQMTNATYNQYGRPNGYSRTTAKGQIYAMAADLADKLHQSGGDYGAAIGGYNSGSVTKFSPGYVGAVNSYLSKNGVTPPSMPLDRGQSNILRNQSDMSDAATSSSQATFNEVGPALDGLVTAVQNLKAAWDSDMARTQSQNSPSGHHFTGR